MRTARFGRDWSKRIGGETLDRGKMGAMVVAGRGLDQLDVRVYLTTDSTAVSSSLRRVRTISQYQNDPR